MKESVQYGDIFVEKATGVEVVVGDAYLYNQSCHLILRRKDMVIIGTAEDKDLLDPSKFTHVGQYEFAAKVT